MESWVRIPLSQGWSTVVDLDDFIPLIQFNWTAHSAGYAYRCGSGKSVMMHRQIMDTPKGMDTDHINRDKLDNRRANLRIVNRSRNNLNRGLADRGFEKTSTNVPYDGFLVRYYYNSQRIYVGYAKTKEAARIKYERSVREKVPECDWELMGITMKGIV